MSRGSYFICWSMALVVFAAPLPFGSVRPVAMAIVQIAILAATLVWISLRNKAEQSPLPWRDPILLAGSALFLYGILQAIPLPRDLVGFLSPESARIWSTYSSASPSWVSLSIDPYATWHSCLLIACWTLAALLIRHNAIDLKGRLTVAFGLVAGGFFQASYGLFEFISGRQHIFGYEKKYFTDVATGTFISRNNFAGYLEMAIPLTLALAVLATSSRTGVTGKSWKHQLAQVTGREGFKALIFVMSAFLMAIGILMSQSRMGIMSIAFAMLIGAIFLGLRGQARRFGLASVAVVGLVTIFSTQIDILPVVERFRSLGWQFGPGYGRLHIWQQAVGLAAAYPLFGSGFGTWETAFSPFRDDVSQVRVDFAHNDYLEFFTESGAFGMVVLLLAAFYLLRHRRRQTSTQLDEISVAAGIGLLAIALHSFTDFHLSVPADALGVAVLIGLFMRPAGPAGALSTRKGAGQRALLRFALAGLCAVVLTGLSLTAASPAAAHVRSLGAGFPSDATVEDVDSGPLSRSAASPDDDLCPACRIEPFNAVRYFEAGTRARLRLLLDVEALIRAQAAGHVPNPDVRIYLSERLQDALNVVNDGLALAPASGRGHLEAGLLFFGRYALTVLPPSMSTDYQNAIEEFTLSLALEPWRAAPHLKVARILLPLWPQSGDSQKEFIRRVAERALGIDPTASDVREAVMRLDS